MSVDRSSRTHSPLNRLAHRAKPESFFPYSICTPKTGPEHHRRAAYGSDISAPATRNLSLARVLASDAPPPPLARFATPRTNCSSSTSAPTPARSTSAPWTTWDRGSEQTQPFRSRPPAPASPLSWRPFPPTPSAAPPRSPSVAPDIRSSTARCSATSWAFSCSHRAAAAARFGASSSHCRCLSASSRSRFAFALWISFTRSSRPAFSAIVRRRPATEIQLLRISPLFEKSARTVSRTLLDGAMQRRPALPILCISGPPQPGSDGLWFWHGPPPPLDAGVWHECYRGN